MSNDNLKKLVKECISLDNIYDKCEECGRPTLLHEEDVCTRTVEEGLEVVAKNWRDLRRRLKPILKEIQDERQKEAEQTVYLDGIKRLTTQIHDQNRSNMNLYNENMTTLVQSLKDSLPKTGVKTDGISTTAGGTNKAAKLLPKPAKFLLGLRT